MPRVVDNQKDKFQTDTTLRQLQQDSEIRYTDHQECSLEERRLRFRADCCKGTCKIGFVSNGVHLCLSVPETAGSQRTLPEYVDFGRERGKVFLTFPLILNGVCVKFCGYIDLEKLAGAGHLEFDEKSAEVENRIRQETLTAKTSQDVSSPSGK